MQPLQDNQPHFEWEEIGEEDNDPTRGLKEDDAAQHDTQDTVVGGVVLVAIQHLVGRDDGHSREGAAHCTRLQDPVPTDLLGALPEPWERGRPGREEEDGLCHQNTVLQGGKRTLVSLATP